MSSITMCCNLYIQTGMSHDAGKVAAMSRWAASYASAVDRY